MSAVGYRILIGIITILIMFPNASDDSSIQLLSCDGIENYSRIIRPPIVWEDDFNDTSKIYFSQHIEMTNGSVSIIPSESTGLIASLDIACPMDMRYDFAMMKISKPGSSKLSIAVLNATEVASTPGYINEPIPGFILCDRMEISLLSLNPLTYPRIRLQANLEASGIDRPTLFWWAVFFTGRDEWREDFIGREKTLINSLTNITDGSVSINLSMRKLYTSESGSYESFPPIIANYYWSDGGKPQFFVFYPTVDRTGYQSPVRIGNHDTYDFESGDFDKDGHLDLVVVNNAFNNNEMTESWILWGCDKNTWNIMNITNLSTTAATCAGVGDFNCDGFLDIAIGNWSYDTSGVFIFINRGGRQLGPTPDIVLPAYHLEQIDTGDLNNDGFDDIAMAEDYNNHNRVYYGGINGPDAIADIQYPTSPGVSTYIHDLDKDGYLDLIIKHYRLDSKGTAIFMGGPLGPDTTADYNLSSDSMNKNIGTGDVNKDGYEDLVLGRGYTTNPKMHLFMGSSSGWSDSLQRIMTVTASISDVSILDINKDGYDDVVTVSAQHSNIRIYFGGSTGLDTTEDITLSTLSSDAVEVVVPCKELSGVSGSIITKAIDKPVNKRWDIVVVEGDLPAGTSIRVSVLDSNLREIPGFIGLDGPDIDISDLNINRVHLKMTLSSQDRAITPTLHMILVKWMDLNVWRDEFYGRVKVERTMGFAITDGHITAMPSFSTGTQLVFTGFLPDTISSSDSFIFSPAQDEDNMVQPPIRITNPNGAAALDIGDANGDGYSDIVFAVPRTSDVCSTATSPIHFGGILGVTPILGHAFETIGATDVLLKDINLDGYMDVVFAQERDHDDYSVRSTLFWGNAGGWNDTPDVELSTFGASGVEAIDRNRDGRFDLVFACYRDVTTATDSLVFLQGANGFCGTQADYYLPTNGARAVASGDLNRDGHIDLVFANSQASGLATTDSYVYWGKASGGFQATPMRLPTVGARDVALADLDHDLDLDIVFANERDDFLDYSIDSYVYLNDGVGGFGTGPATKLPTVGAVAVEVANFDNTGNLDIIFACSFDGTSFFVPARAYLGDASGWPAEPSFTLPMTGGSDVRAAPVFKVGTGAYVSRDISPLDPYDTGTFHTLRCNLSLDAQQNVGIGLIDAKTWEVLVEREVGAGAIEWDLSGVFRVREHPSVRVFVTVPNKAALQAFAMDDLWLNWTKRVRAAPAVLAMNVSSATVLRTKSLDLNALITDEYDLAGELNVEFACKPNASSVWTSSYISGIGFVQGNWTARFLPLANAVMGAYDLKVTVTDKDWLSTELVVGSALRVINNRPSTPEVRLSPGRPVTTDTLTVSIFQRASDVENEPISYHYVWFMDGVRQAGPTGTSVYPSLTTRGQNWSVEVRAFDGLDEGEPARAWSVIQNAPPTTIGKLAIRSMQEDTVDSTSVNLTGAFEDPDGDALTWRLLSESLNVSVSIDADIGQVTIAPRRNWHGWENVTFIASDGELQAEQRLLITVLPIDDPPMIVMVNGKAVGTEPIHLIAVQDEVLFINITVLDIEGDALVFSISTQRVSIDVNGSIRFVPTNDDISTLTFEVVAMEERDPTMRSSVNITLEILNVNDPMTSPVIITPQNGTRFASNQGFWLNATCTDPDERHNQELNYTWASNLTGIIGWGPSLRVGALGPGLHNVTLTVSDGEFQRTASVEILVEEPTTPPPPPPDGEEVHLPILLMGVIVGVVLVGLVIAILVLKARRVASALASVEAPIDEEARKKEVFTKLSGIIDQTLEKLEREKRE